MFQTPFLYIMKQKFIAFPYGTNILIYMKQFLRSAHLNFGNSTHKFLHINQFMFKKTGGSAWIPIYALETHKI